MERYDLASRHEALERLLSLCLEGGGEGRRLLLLLSGGSCVSVETALLQALPKGLPLSVALADERYGPVGHAQSNWRRLEAAGAPLQRFKALPVLRGAGFPETVADYGEELAAAIDAADRVIGIFGIGRDGHTAGILPGSRGVTDEHTVIGYAGPDFARVTIAWGGLRQVDEAVLYAEGPEKADVLERLAEDVAPQAMPAQLLRRLPRLQVLYLNQPKT